MPSCGTVPRRAPGVRALCLSHVHCPQVAQKCSNQMGCCRGMAGADWCNDTIGIFVWVELMACSVASPVVRPGMYNDNGIRSARPVRFCSTGWCSRTLRSRAAWLAPECAARRDLPNEPRIVASRESTPERGAAKRSEWPAHWHRLARAMRRRHDPAPPPDEPALHLLPAPAEDPAHLAGDFGKPIENQ